ncbi:unnamed protein product, partial [Rotaria sp. Silwood2]
MKIDQSKLEKYLPGPPVNCKLFIDKLKSCDRQELHELLKSITIWPIETCVLYDWINVLDLFDSILEEACIQSGIWMLNLDILHFTTLLIEHSYSRHIYNSIEYLIILLQSSDLNIVCGVLSLLYVSSRRSNFITRLKIDKKQGLIYRLGFLAETWGGRENGFDLVRCCSIQNSSNFPEYATNFHFPYAISSESISKQIDILNVHMVGSNASSVMEMILDEHKLSEDKQIKLFTNLRLVYSFSLFNQRLLCIQARLQALSILKETNNILYDGLIEELVEILNIQNPILTDIKVSALETLTSMVYLKNTIKYLSYLEEIIKVTQINSYHGFLPTFVREYDNNDRFPQSLSIELLSFLYHLAKDEKSGQALVNCDIAQSFIKIINYYDESQDFLVLVTRAIHIIDLITTLDMTSFQTNNGLQIFINRFQYEITQCKKEQPFIIDISDINQETTSTTIDIQSPISSISQSKCYHQRIASLKSILNYFKKSFTEPEMFKITHNIMNDSLLNSFKHIISNVQYYGSSLFHLTIHIIISFICQNPLKLSLLQNNGLADILMYVLLKKDLPISKDIIESLPNIFSGLCLNKHGLDNFIKFKPFDKLFEIFLLPKYLPIMIKRDDNNTSLICGNSIDELIRHQIILRYPVIISIIILIEKLVELGNNDNSNLSTTNVRISIPLVDYITNITCLIKGVINNNLTDDHGREFVRLGGLKALFEILQMKYLPVDFPSSQACQSVIALCKSILTLSIKDDNLIEMVITNLDTILISLTDFYSNPNYDSSLLIEELSRSISLSSSTTILHKLSIVHSHISLLISFCKISKNEVRNLLINFLSNEIGIRILKNLNKLCLTLIYEKSILLSLCSFETNIIENDLTTNEIFIKTIKPLLYVSSKLSQALSEFYNLLVKQCATSQMKPISRRFNQQSFVYTPTKAATLVASILIEVLKDGLSFNLSANTNLTENQIEKLRLTFFICTIGFAIPMLFDKHHHPYMLMLQQFELSKTQDALFSALEWTLNLINLNVKSILESPYSISKKSQTEQNDNIPFNPLDYLILTHKRTFHLLTNSCSILWDKPYLLKDHATKIINNILSILSHILSGEIQIQKKIQEEEEQQQQQTCLSLEFFDNFINSIILKILDKLPDTIYKMSELILTIIHHNDIKWCENFLEIIFNDIKTNYLLLIDLLNQQIFLN